MFLSFYGLREQPFGVTPDPRFLYFGEVHREAVASLVYGVEAGLGFASLIAEPGTGKTTLLYYLLARYRAIARTAFIFESQCTSEELLRNLLFEFEIGDAGLGALDAVSRLKEFLAQQARTRRRVIVVLDEAQNFDESVLETVRLLSNFETAGSKLIHIILSGQPQLAEKLSRPQMLNVRQRITIASRLRPFAAVDVVKYVAHRLTVAGYQGGAPFTPAALEAISRLSGGVPREINRLCFSALSVGCALERRVIDADLLREVASDFDFSSVLNTETVRKAFEIPPMEDLAREFADALSRAQQAAASRQAGNGAVARPPSGNSGQSAAAAPAGRRPDRITEPAPRSPMRPCAAAQVMPLQSWIANDARRTSRVRSAVIAGVIGLLALAAVGTQLLPAPEPHPSATTAVSQPQAATAAAAPTQVRSSQHQTRRYSHSATEPHRGGTE